MEEDPSVFVYELLKRCQADDLSSEECLEMVRPFLEHTCPEVLHEAERLPSALQCWMMARTALTDIARAMCVEEYNGFLRTVRGMSRADLDFVDPQKGFSDPKQVVAIFKEHGVLPSDPWGLPHGEDSVLNRFCTANESHTADQYHKVVKFLLSAPLSEAEWHAIFARRDVVGDTHLLSAIRSPNPRIAEAIAVAAAKIDPKLLEIATQPFGATPLLLATMQGRATIVHCLVGLGANLDVRTKTDGRLLRKLTGCFKAEAQARNEGSDPMGTARALLLSPRIADLDLGLRSAEVFERDDGSITPSAETTFIEEAVENPRQTNAHLRRLACIVVAEQERIKGPGSCDPSNVLGLRPREGDFWARFVPRSDQPLPDPEYCGGCASALGPGKSRCSRCKEMWFCDKACQLTAWKEHHKHNCTLFVPNRLPRAGRVFRYHDGASVTGSTVPSKMYLGSSPDGQLPITPFADFRASNHQQLLRGHSGLLDIIASYIERRRACACLKSDDFCPCQVVGEPCFDACKCQFSSKNPHNNVYLPFSEPAKAAPSCIRLSGCAASHHDVVSSLTAAQLDAHYRLASCQGLRGDAHHCAHGAAGCALRELLAKSDPCKGCLAMDDREQFFSFCLNRSVNADRVHHCESCGTCFYHRVENVGACTHCGQDPKHPNAEPKDENYLPILEESEFGRKGFWGGI